MKKVLTSIIFLLLGLSQVLAQNTNSWIDYNQTYYKIKITEDGLHRLPFSVLEEHNLPQDPSKYRLFHLGKEVPLHVSTGGSLDAGDYFEFIGHKNSGAFDEALYEKPKFHLNPNQSLFNDTAAYFLVWDANQDGLRYGQPTNDIGNPAPAAEFCWREMREDIATNFSQGVPYYGIGGYANYFSAFGEGEGFVDYYILENQTKSISFSLENVYRGGEEQGYFYSRVVGQSNDPSNLFDHHFKLRFNSVTVSDTLFEGYHIADFSKEIPLDQLKIANTIHFQTILQPQIVVDKVSIVYYGLRYPHTFNFEGEEVFEFTLDNNEATYLEIENFDGGVQPVLYDQTNQLRIVPVEQNGKYYFNLPAGANTAVKRQLTFYSTSCLINGGCLKQEVQTMERKQFKDYSELANQGDYIIISHPFLMQGNVNQVERYQAYRSSVEGGDYQAIVVDIEELYDQYAYGVRKHPLSIKYFVNQAIERWQIAPTNLFLLGKSIDYQYFVHGNNNRSEFSKNLVPTYGNKGTDLEFSSEVNGRYAPRLATGRVSARSPEQVRAYLNKVIAYEQPKPCTKEDRAWAKEALHIAGGFDAKEARDFANYLRYYEQLYEQGNIAGEVVFTFKKESIGSEEVENPELDALMNNGLGIINFVGHSSSEYWDVALEGPEYYTNHNKLPFVLSSSCFVGDVHATTIESISMSEDYVLADSLGAIGFIATVAFGFPSYMNIYMSKLYESFCTEDFGEPIGMSIQKTVDTIEFLYPESQQLKFTSEQFNYQGDPAIRIGYFERPEFILEQEDIFFEPENITANLDSFAVKIVLSNMGRYEQDSIEIQIDRTYPNSSTVDTYTRSFEVPSYRDTLYFYVPIGDVSLIAGNNEFDIKVNPNMTIEEDCYDNNQVKAEAFVFADLLVPIAPCNMSIVNTDKVKLMASTGQPILDKLPYQLQIDTTATFNRPLADTALYSLSGVIEWEPNFEFEDGKVYYWRATQLTPSLTAFNWQVNSFLYDRNEAAGWSQSHFYQFQENTYNRMYLDSLSRLFDFSGEENIISAQNDRNSLFGVRIIQNYTNQLIFGSCLKSFCAGGFNIVSFKPSKILDPLGSFKENLSCSGDCECTGSYGNVQCGSGEKFGVEFFTNSRRQLDDMLIFMNETIPDGYYVLIFSSLEHRLGTNDSDLRMFDRQDEIFDFMESLGIPEARTKANPEESFIAFGRKGHSNYPGEFHTGSVLDVELSAIGKFDNALTYSSRIGPALNWESVTADYSSLEALDIDQDSVRLDVMGIGKDDSEERLMRVSLADLPLDLSSIDAQEYRYIRLKAYVSDPLLTPPQLDFWRVNYEMAGELALNSRALLEITDTIFEGQTMTLRYAITNAGSQDMENIQAKYVLTNSENKKLPTIFKTISLIKAGETIIEEFTHNTIDMPAGNSKIEVEINPGGTLLEKFAFNNKMFVPFFIRQDQVNPIIDVTFDGRHILDGEIISASPEIFIRLKDENVYLPLDNPENFNVILVYPDEATGKPTREVPLSLTEEWAQFIPAQMSATSEGNNEASVLLHPEFLDDGLYELRVEATDRSGNAFSRDERAYSITFEIIKKPMISQLLNYPNPFTSSTRFVFLLTGTQVPEFMKVQIMTPTGKVVREITQAELGEIRIGKNVTDFVWDGTDSYGNQLANGVYLYRVIARVNGQDLENYQTATDAFFEKDMGKMYLMR